MTNLSKNVKITPAILPSAGAAGTTDIEGATLDMSGFEGVLIMIVMGAITATAVTSIKAQQGAESDLSDAADLEDSGQDIADDDDNQTFFIDLYRPAERYVRLLVDRGTANAAVASATYIQYSGRKPPFSHASGVSGELIISPDEGTA